MSNILLLHEAIIDKGGGFVSFEEFLRRNGLIYSLHQSFITSKNYNSIYSYSEVNDWDYLIQQWIKYIIEEIDKIFPMLKSIFIDSKNVDRDLERIRYYNISSFEKNDFLHFLKTFL